ncbi:MAG: DUF1636 family protein [Albidovulum sp.]
MTGIAVTVCRSCAAGQAGLAAELRKAANAAEIYCTVRETDCMSGCTRASTVAVRANGKTAYLFGECSTDEIANLLTFLQLYAASPDGNLTDARMIGTLREKAIARIPG